MKNPLGFKQKIRILVIVFNGRFGPSGSFPTNGSQIAPDRDKFET